MRKHGVEARVYSGRLGDVGVPHGSTWPLTLIDLKLEGTSSIAVPVPGGNRAFAYVLEGTSLLGLERRKSQAGEVAWAELSPSNDDWLVASDESARMLVFASPVIDEPVVMGGPFVMNTREEIDQAFDDLRAGRLKSNHRPRCRISRLENSATTRGADSESARSLRGGGTSPSHFFPKSPLQIVQE